MSAIERGMEPRALRLAPRGGTDGLGRHDSAVLDALRATAAHPTAAQVYDAVRTRYPRIGQATVYRALTRLLAAGLVVDVGRDALGRHYDARTERHDHAICVACGRVCDLPTQPASLAPASLAPEVLAPLTVAARQVGMRVTSYEVRLYGVCAACDDQRHVSENAEDIQNSANSATGAADDRAHPRESDPDGTREEGSAHE